MGGGDRVLTGEREAPRSGALYQAFAQVAQLRGQRPHLARLRLDLGQKHNGFAPPIKERYAKRVLNRT
jgi:hypothetical protein